MPRRSSRRVGSRALALIVVAIGVQLGAGGIAAATADTSSSAPSAPPPSVTDQLAAESTTTTADPTAAPADATSSASAPAATPAPSSTAVTISRAQASGTHTVSIVDFAFDPTALTVKLGDTVQWINNGTAEEGHNVIGDGIQSPVLHTGESYSFTFTTAGTYSYICTIHPKMAATIEVVDPNADKTTPTKKSGHSSGGNSSSGASKGRDSSGSAGTSSSGSAATTTGSGSESAAVASAGAAGGGGSLPSTGSDALGLTAAGLALLALGLAIRTPFGQRALRRS
jgi:plastocyanin